MPTYSYACTACEHRFDTVQAFTDSSLTDCPECAGRLRKLFSSVGIVFKGSGFYRTDSRSAPPTESGGDKPPTGADGKSTADKSGSEKSSPEKSGAEKSGAEKSGSEQSGSTSTSKPGSAGDSSGGSASSSANSSSASAAAS